MPFPLGILIQGKPTQLLFLLELLVLPMWQSDPRTGRQKRMDVTTSSLWKCREPELIDLGWAPDLPGPGCSKSGSWSRWILLKSRSNDSPRNAEGCNMSICTRIWEWLLMQSWDLSGLDRDFYQGRDILGIYMFPDLAACPNETLIMQQQSNLSSSKKKSAVLRNGESNLSVMAKIWNCAVYYVSWHKEACKEWK